MNFLKFVFLIFLGMGSHAAWCLESSTAPAKVSGSQQKLPFALVEWNPADRLADRYRLAWEYSVIDGFAFGLTAEHQRSWRKDWRIYASSLGITATQYFNSQALDGPFVKGEFAPYVADYDDNLRQARGRQGGVYLEGALGYRINPVPYLTLSASYGARRWLHSFFEDTPGRGAQFMASAVKNWEMHVVLGLGLGF